MRPLKVGLDYYSHDVKASDDRKIKLLMAKFGIMGYGFFFRICDMIYDEHGYFTTWTEEDEILFIAETRLEEDKCKHLLDYCLHLQLFDRGLFEKYQILTSRRIQANYIRGCDRRTEIEMITDYLLIEPEKELKRNSKLQIIRINVNNNGVNVNINPVNDDISTQKEKEKEKEKETTVENISRGVKEDDIIPKKRKEITEEGIIYANQFKNTLPSSNKITDAMIKSWAETFDELVRIDGRESKQIYEVTKWARKDSFWSDNFLSATKLRKKNPDGVYYYDVFLNKMRGQNNGKHGKDYSVPEYDPDSDW